MPLLIPISADIRTGLISIMSSDLGVIEFALQNSFSLGGTRFREWEPFAPLIDFGVLLDVDPVVEVMSNVSCRSKFYDARFTLYVQHGASGSSLIGQWLGVLESALDDASESVTGVSGQTILVKDVEFVSRGPQVRLEESWRLSRLFRCKVAYG